MREKSTKPVHKKQPSSPPKKRIAKSAGKTVFKKRKNKTYFWTAYFIFISLFIFVLSAFSILFITIKDLPPVQSLKNYKYSFTTRLYSRDGALLNNYSLQNRVFIAIDDIPEVIKQAFLSAEDATFYSHSGIDIKGILNAAYKNFIFFIKGEKQLIGASTITQQVVKNILLTNEKTFTRKVKEIILSLEVSRIFTKNEILELYLNHIFLGSGSYGIVAAAHEYFNKPLNDLTIEEAALLAALPKAPSEINPRRNLERALERRNWVLQRMLENSYITKELYETSRAAEINIVKDRRLEKPSYGINSFSDYAKSIVSASLGSQAFLSGGYYVQTTLDYTLQKILYQAFRKGIMEHDQKMGYRPIGAFLPINEKICSSLNNFIEKAEITDDILKYGAVLDSTAEGLTLINELCEKIFLPVSSFSWINKSITPEKIKIYFQKGQVVVYEKAGHEEYILSQMPEVNGSAIIMNPKNGEVMAMIGDFYDRPNGFNRAIFAKRQLGSAIKPFVYLTALENGFSPASTLVDEDLRLADEWQPRNATKDFMGLITLRTAFERSRNVPTVRLAEILGSGKFIKRFNDFNLNVEPIDNDLTTVLGSFSVTLERVAKAFSVFVNKGRKPESIYVLKIQDAEGKTIFAKDGDCGKRCLDIHDIPLIEDLGYGKKVAEEDVTFQVLSMLEGAGNRGTGRSIRHLSPFGIGGKTGSTNEHKDAWFAGVTNNFSIVIYVGYDKPKTLGASQYGAVVALPIFREIIKNTIPIYPITPFTAPESIEQIKIEYDTGEIAVEDSINPILENFKKTDKKPRQPVLKLLEEDGEIEEKILQDQLDKGIY